SEVAAGVARQEVEHVVEEADPGRDRSATAAVEIDGDLDVGLLGGALDRAFAHERFLSFFSFAHVLIGKPVPTFRGHAPRAARLLSGVAPPRHSIYHFDCTSMRQCLSHWRARISACSPHPPTSGTARRS